MTKYYIKKENKLYEKSNRYRGGPAGLTAAYEILNRTDSCQVLVLEEKNQIGGLAKTVDFQDYRMDLGGHRFLW